MSGEDHSPLRGITERLEALAGELAAEQDSERAAELVREASKLAAEAGEEVDRALRQAQGGDASAA
jgi:hypothetical protein